jgi:hypothetical protein
MAARTQQSSGISPPLQFGAIFGAISFVVGYVLTLLVVVAIEADEFTDDLLETTGWLYYNAQFANIETSAEGGGEFGELFEEEFNYLTDSGGFGGAADLEAPAVLYHLIPIVVLLVAGFAVARYANASSLQEGAVAGATLVLGTVVLALIGTFLFTNSGNGFSASPVLVDGIVFVGILFPAVLGAVGGAVSTVVGSSQQQYRR